MSLGNAERRRSWSIVFRLSASYAAITITLFSLSGALLYWFLKESLDVSARNTVADKISVMREILRERPNDREALEEEVQWESTARRQSVYYSRLLRDNGALVIESAGSQNLIPELAACPPPAPEDRPIGETREFRPTPERTVLVSSAWVTSSPNGRGSTNTPERFIYTVALDITPEHQILHDYRNKMLLVLIAGSVVSAVAGTYVARRGIRPIQEISAAAHRITANALAERVGATTWPRELAGLASEFDGMLQRLEDSFKRLSQFSADIAHELRTPINNLTGEAEIALRKDRTNAEYARVIGSSLEEYHRLSDLIDSLLFLARAENADLRPHLSRFQVSEELGHVLAYHDLEASECGIKLTSFGDASLTADPTLFRRALSNVVSNALKHTSAGGAVSIEVRSDSEAVELLVKDNGQGIPAEHLPRLFDRFYRVDASRTSSGFGTGLGLAIVKTIMELHKGSVAIDSEVGNGTEVRLTFPVKLFPESVDEPER